MKDEIENIDDGFLNNLRNQNGFDVPEKYFDQSKASILSKINADSDFIISNNEGGFVIPNNYFETNQSQILSKINNKIKVKTNVFNFTNWQLVSGMAALFIAIISLFIFLNNNKTYSLSTNLNKVSEAEMIDYLSNNDVKIEWINEANLEIKSDFKKDKNNTEIEQYLLEHADEQALFEEL